MTSRSNCAAFMIVLLAACTSAPPPVDPPASASTPPSAIGTEFTGQPISMNLKDADLRNVLATFGKLTGLEMRVEEGINGKVTTTWTNVPWDQALDTLLKERGLAYRIEKRAIYVSRSR